MQNLKNTWPVILLPVLLIVFFGDTVAVLHHSWILWDQAYSHGYLIVGLLAFWVMRESRHIGLAWDTKTWPLAFAALLGTLFAWYSGRVIQFQVLEQVALLGIAWSWLWVVGGWSLAKRLIAPFAIGLLAIPLWDVLISSLQDLTVFVVSHITQWIGITAYIENNTVELPYGMLVIADGCAGLNLFLVSLSVGAIYSYMYLTRPKSIAICIGSLLALGLFTNWLRVLSLVIIGYVTEMESDIVYEHGTFGWMIFAGVLVLFFYLYRRVEKTDTASTRELEAINPLQHPGFWFAVAALIAVPTWASLLAMDGEQRYAPRQLALSNVVIEPTDNPAWQPVMSGYDVHQSWVIRATGDPVYVNVFSYTSQRQGKELIYYSNKIAEKYEMKPLQWTPEAQADIPPMNSAIVTRDQEAHIVMWVYKVGPWYTRSQLVAKLLQLPASFTRHRMAELVTVSMVCNDLGSTCDSEYEMLNKADFSSLLRMLFSTIDNSELTSDG